MKAHSPRSTLIAERKALTKQVKELTKKITGIDRALAKLDASKASAPAPRAKTNNQSKAVGAKGKAKQSENSLPRTGGDFWISMMGKRGRSFTELVERAGEALAKKTKKNLTEDDKRLLALRARVALKTLADTNAIRSEGSGRTRRYSTLA